MADLKPEGYRHSADIWEVLFQMKERERPVMAQVGAIDFVDGKPVWVLAFPGYPDIKGYVPESETGVESPLVARFVGQDVLVLIKGLDRENNLVACSRRQLVERARNEIDGQFDLGDIIPVIIKAVLLDEQLHSSLVVDVGGGYLLEMPRAQAVTRLAVPLRQQYTVGQTVDARVIGLEPLAVSIRAARPNPWTVADFKRGQYISGTVYRIIDERGHVLIEPDLCPGILGLTSVPLLGNLIRGDRATCKVYNFSAELKRLHLSIVRIIK